MAVTWNPSDKDSQWTLSGGDLTATLSVFTGSWYTCRATHGFSPFQDGGVYWEVKLNTAFANLMIGVTTAAAGLGATYTSLHCAFASSPSYGYSVAPVLLGAYPAAFSSGAPVVGCFYRQGKLWFSINGVYSSSGDPAADTYPSFYNWPISTADLYPTIVGYSSAGNNVTLRAKASDLSYSPPAGARLLESHFNLSTTLVDASNNPITSHAVKWAVFYQATPDSLALIDATGTGTTDGSGVLEIDYDQTSIPVGGTCSVLISDTDGTADLNCKSVYIARSPTIT